MEARVILSKETKEKMGKPLSAWQKGELRWRKLEEAEKEGKLILCSNRHEVAAIGGFPSYGQSNPVQRHRGYAWVSGLIRRGMIEETLVTLADGEVQREYRLKPKASTPQPESQPESKPVEAPAMSAPEVSTPEVFISSGSLYVEIRHPNKEVLETVLGNLIDHTARS